MGFACAANFAAQRGVDRSPAKAVSVGTNRQEPGSRGSPARDAGYCEPSPIRMAHAYDDRGLSPASGCRGTRTVDATTSWFLAMNSRTRSLPAPIFIRFIRCTLKTDRFVLAVIPSRKRITQKISVRFARRPFRNNMCGPTPLLRKDILHGLFQLVFSPPGA
jgi:hypothetical protein